MNPTFFLPQRSFYYAICFIWDLSPTPKSPVWVAFLQFLLASHPIQPDVHSKFLKHHLVKIYHHALFSVSQVSLQILINSHLLKGSCNIHYSEFSKYF